MKRKLTFDIAYITKNDRDVLERSLNFFLVHLSGLQEQFTINILDTGSTDKTLDMLESFKQFLNVNVYSEPFINFVDSKNKILEHCKSDYIIFMDSDEYFTNVQQFKELVEACYENEVIETNIKDIVLYGNEERAVLEYSRIRAFKNHIGIKFNGPGVHEYLETNSSSLAYLPHIIVKHCHPTYKNYDARNKKILKILLSYLKINQNDSRAIFYTARTYKDMCEYDRAILFYKKYLSLPSTWHEERYVSCVDAAECYEELGQTDKALEYLENAELHNVHTRPDAKFHKARLLHKDKRFNEALLHLSSIDTDKKPACKLFFDCKIYKKINDLKERLLIKTDSIKYKIDNYFDKIYIISLDSKLDRYNDLIHKLSSKNITNIQKISAYNGEIMNFGTTKYFLNQRYVACTLSHLHAMYDAKMKNYDKILILEDDVLIHYDIENLFNDLIHKVGDWDLLYLGHYHYKFIDNKWVPFNQVGHVIKSNDHWCCHGYAVNSKLIENVLSYYKSTPFLNQKEIDRYLVEDIQTNESFECKSLNPNLLIQKNGWSSNTMQYEHKRETEFNTIYANIQNYI